MYKDSQSTVVIANVGKQLDGDVNGDPENGAIVEGVVKYYAAMKKMEAFLCVQIRKDLWDTGENSTTKGKGRVGVRAQKGERKDIVPLSP